jgi:urea transport system substrate-binding protein
MTNHQDPDHHDTAPAAADPDAHGALTRRNLLIRGAGVAAAFGFGSSILAACGSDEEDGATTADAGTAPAATTTPDAGTTPAAGTEAAGGAPSGEPIKIGVLTDVTGGFSVVGASNVAVAQFTADKINAEGGILGRPVEIVVGDGASDAAAGATAARTLVESDQVDVVIGGVASFTREAVKGIIAERADTLYIWPASYEGGECTPNVYSTGAAPNQQLDPLVPWLLENKGTTFFLAGADYIYPRNVLAYVRELVEAGGGTVVGEEYYPLDATDVSTLISQSIDSGADVVFSVAVLPLSVQYHQGLRDGGFEGTIAGTLFDETAAVLFGEAATGMICCQDYIYSAVDAASQKVADDILAGSPDTLFTSTINSPAWYRSFYLYKAAVEAAGTTSTAEVGAAFDSASFPDNPGGPAAMKPGTRHCSLPIYIGEVQADGSVKLLVDAGVIDPVECG